jgi:hypothetical protein
MAARRVGVGDIRPQYATDFTLEISPADGVR